MADINITFKKPVTFTVNGKEYAIKPLPAGDAFRVEYLVEHMSQKWGKDNLSTEKVSQDMLNAYDTIAKTLAKNAADPEGTRAIFEALKENDGLSWIKNLSLIIHQLGV